MTAMPLLTSSEWCILIAETSQQESVAMMLLKILEICSTIVGMSDKSSLHTGDYDAVSEAEEIDMQEGADSVCICVAEL